MEPLRVSNIQRFSINDGDGIRTAVFLAGCPLRCAWCANPETWEEDPDPSAYPPGAAAVLGDWMSPPDILAAVRRDSVFHRFSFGGVTWSGGEPFAGSERFAALVRVFSEAGIHQAVETSAFFPWDSCQDTVRLLDFLFVDIKHMDDRAHRAYTGVGNLEILENIRRIGAAGKDVVVRMPLVKGVNDGRSNLERTASFVRENIPRPRMEILPYHDLGREKYELLGLSSRRRTFDPPGPGDLAQAEEIAGALGVEVVRYR